MAQYLTRWGTEVDLAATAREGLQHYRERAYDAALVDYGLAHTNGIALARQMRKVDAEMERTSAPILLLAMLGENAHSRIGTDVPNIVSRMTKPIRLGQLRRRLVGLLEHGLEHADELKEKQSEFERDLAIQHPLRIIIAEDNVVNQKVTRRLLRQLGYRTDMVANGLEAVQAVQRQTYDLVLMDVQMPEVDGLEATRRIRADDAIQQPRIVAMTAAAMHDDKQECLAAGMNDYIAKPVEVSDLIDVLRATRRHEEADATSRGGGNPPMGDGDVATDGRGINPNAFASFCAEMGSEEKVRVRELIEDYIRNAREAIDIMQQFARLMSADVDTTPGPAEKLARTAHDLKTSSETIGAVELGTTCERMEALVKSDALDEALALVPHLVEQFDRAEKDLRVLKDQQIA
jgi:CheY-like chemotaxis protein